MALLELEVRELNSFFATGVFTGSTIYPDSFNTPGGGSRPFYYDDRLDQIVVRQDGQDGILYCDPLFDSPASAARNRYVAFSPQTTDSVVVGEFDRNAGVQKVYGNDNTATQELDQIDERWEPIAVDPIPTLGRRAHRTKGAGEVGYYDTADDAGMIIMETFERAYSAHCRVRTGAGIQESVFGEIDLATGDAVPLAIPVRYQATPANAFQAPLIFGDAFDFRDLQFVPDEDSSPTAPKGFLMLWSLRENDLSTGGGSAGTLRVYFKFVDFNPTGKVQAPGTPNRVHLRETLFSRLFLLEETAPELGGIGEIAGVGEKLYNGDAIWYHPPSRTIRGMFSGAGILQEDQVLVVHSQIPALATVSPPTAVGTVETGKTTRFQIQCKGDLGEPVATLGVDWALRRGSTKGETFDTSSGTETSVFVANPPIDADTLVFYFNGTPLTLTTDYTVNEATGEITGQGSHSPFNTSGYTADYEHRTNTVEPPHSALVGTSSRTDQDGVAETRVRIPFDSDLEGALEELEATVEDQV